MEPGALAEDSRPQVSEAAPQATAKPADPAFASEPAVRNGAVERAFAAWRRLLAAIAVVEQVVGVLLVANIVLQIAVQVFSRYVLNRPLVWVEELATYSFIWATFIGASLGLKRLRHVRIETFVGRLSPQGQAAFRALIYALMLALLLVLLPQAWTVMGVEGRSLSISLPVLVPRSWFYSIPLFVGAASMALTLAYLLAAELWTLAGGARQPPILPPEPPDEDEEREMQTMERVLGGGS